MLLCIEAVVVAVEVIDAGTTADPEEIGKSGMLNLPLDMFREALDFLIAKTEASPSSSPSSSAPKDSDTFPLLFALGFRAVSFDLLAASLALREAPSSSSSLSSSAFLRTALGGMVTANRDEGSLPMDLKRMQGYIVGGEVTD